MKKFITICAIALALCACKKENAQTALPNTLCVNIDGLGATTKAGIDNVRSGIEDNIRSIEILVFSAGDADANSYLDLYHPCTPAEITAKSATLKVKTGDKKVYVVVNGPVRDSQLEARKAKTVADLKAMAIDLSDNSVTTGTAGFVAVGSKALASAETTVSITCTRLVSRIALRSVTNNLPEAYSSMTIKRAWIANVVGNQTLAGTAAAATWYNKQSRVDKATQVQTEIINGSTYAASCPTLTFKDINSSVALNGAYQPAEASVPFFYAYANASTIVPTSFNAFFNAQKTALVVEIEIPTAGTYYYPIVLPNGREGTGVLEANKAYTIDLVVTGLGETDPNRPVTSRSVTATVSVSGWSPVAPYEETI